MSELGRTLDSLPVATYTSELLVSALEDVRDELDLRTERLATGLSVPDKMLVELQLLIDEVPDDRLRTALLGHLDRVAHFLMGYRHDLVDAASVDMWDPFRVLIADVREDECGTRTSV